MLKSGRKYRPISGISVLLFVFVMHVIGYGQTGCPDPQANNYDPQAVQNDGSCTYDPMSVSFSFSTDLPSNLSETSGLVIWNEQLYTHNDDTDNLLYALDENDGSILASVSIDGVENIDWEDLAQDSLYVYVGDFGNNSNGNRTDLRIYKILKSSISSTTISLDTIGFSYEDQVDFSGSGSNNTDFDCEAMISVGDSLYLFTKEWVNEGTSLYVLPKTSGVHTAELSGHINSTGLITGATVSRNDSIVMLSGYAFPGNPFIYLLYDFTATQFFSGNIRQLTLNAQFHPVEGIASEDGLTVFLSNEQVNQPPIEIAPKLIHLDLSDLIGPYFDYSVTAGIKDEKNSDPIAFPNPVQSTLTIKDWHQGEHMTISDLTGKIIWVGVPDNAKIDLDFLLPGTYFIEHNQHIFKILKTKN